HNPIPPGRIDTAALPQRAAAGFRRVAPPEEEIMGKRRAIDAASGMDPLQLTGRLAWSAEEVAAATGLSAQYIRDLAARGELGHVKLGSRYLFLRADVDTLLSRHRVESRGTEHRPCTGTSNEDPKREEDTPIERPLSLAERRTALSSASGRASTRRGRPRK